MPLTRQQRKDLIASQGFDPSTHDFDEASGDILNYPSGVPEDTQSPSEPVLSPPELSPSKSSTFGAVARGAAQSAFPTLAGLGGGAVVSGALAGSALGPVGILLGGIAGAVGVGYGASKLQDAVVPDSVKENLFLRPEDVAEHPIASEVGGLAPSFLAMNPVKSIGAVGRAAGNIGRMLTSPAGREALTAAEMAALKRFGLNAGINAGVQGGINVAHQLSSDEPFSIGSLAKDVVIGGVLNEPTKLGQKLFKFEPTFDGVPTRAQEEAARLAQFEAKLAEQRKQTSQQVAEPPLSPTILPHEAPVGGTVTPSGDILNPGVAQTREKLYPYGTEVTPGPDASRFEHRPLRPADQSAEAILGADPAEQRALDFKTAVREKARQEAEAEVERVRQEILSGPILGSNVSRPEIRPPALATTPSGKEVFPDYTGNMEFDAAKNKAESNTLAEQTQKKINKEKYAEKSKSVEQFDALEPEIKALLARRGINPGQYRVEIKDASGNPILGPTTGKPIAGMADVPTKTVHFGKEAGADTAYHETGHVYLDELARDPKTAGLVTKAFAEMGHPELTAERFVSLNDAMQAGDVTAREKFIGAEEKLMDYLGFQGAKRKLSGEKGKEWVRDTLARFGFGENAASRKISAKMEYDAPKGESVLTGKKEGVEVKAETGKFSEGEAQPKSDYEQYLDVQKKISEKIKKGEYSDEEFQSLWKENETIKNRNGGMPPEKPASVGKNQEESSPIESYEEKLRSFSKDKKMHGAALHDVESILETGLRKGSALDTSSERGWASEGEAALILKDAEEGERIEHNNYSKSRGISEVEAIVFNESAYEPGYVKEFVKKLQEKYPNIPMEVRKDSYALGKNQESSRPLPDDIQEHKPFFNFLTSVTDKIRAGKPGSKTHELVSRAAKNYFDEKSQFEGRYGNSILDAQRDYTTEEGQRVYQYRWAKDNKEPLPFELTAREQELNDKLQPLIERPKHDAKKEGLLVKRGEEYEVGGIKKEGYLPNQFDPEVLARWEKDPTSVEAKRDKRIWKEWLTKKGAKNPDQIIKEWETARREYGDTGGPEFAALRKAEGMGIPWELMDKNPARAWKRYARRAAADIAFYKHMQSKDDVRAALGLKSQTGELPKDVEGIEYIGTEDDVQKMLKFVYGKTRSEFPRIEAFARTISSMIMGPGTSIRNLAAIPPQLVGMDVKMRDVMKGLSKLGEARKEAFEQNVTRADYSEFDRYANYDNSDSVVNTLDKISAFFRKWQGRDWSDKVEGELIYAIGKEWVYTKQAEAQAGNTRAAKLLERVGNLVENPQASTNPEDIKKMATGFVNVVRGSYGPQGLPSWALSGNLAPFVQLNKYSIERWNNVHKDIFRPMAEGNYMPFFKYTLAGLLGGLGIEQLNEVLTGRKGPELDLKETLAVYAKTGDPELLASKAIALAQLSAYAGIVGDMAKLGERAVSGKDLKYANPLSYPAYTFATETIASNFSQAIGAIREGEDPIDTLAELVKVVAIQTIQGVRYANNRLNPEEIERKEEFADLRKYREATGKDAPAGEAQPDEFKNLASKKFKKTSDLSEAAGELPGLLQKAFRIAGNDPYRLKAELRKLKQNSYQSIPAPESQPLEFYDYLNYLRETKGDEEASARLAKFLSQRALNQVKAKMVP